MVIVTTFSFIYNLCQIMVMLYYDTTATILLYSNLEFIYNGYITINEGSYMKINIYYNLNSNVMFDT